MSEPRLPEYLTHILDAITKMRNVVAHGYFEVDLDVVWRTIKDDLPALAGVVRELLTEVQRNQ